MASAVAAHNRAFGEDVVPCSYEDLDSADLILLVGSNTAWCHPVIWQRIEKTRERRGTKLVVIDPRRTETAQLADLHIPVAPDGDIALFNALLASLHDRGLTDEPFLRERCEVPESFFEELPCDPGVEPQLFAELVELVAAHPRMLTLFSQGANQSVCGTDKGNAITNLHLATGRMGRLGTGPFSLTGQPNAMGGREVGGLATTLACHLGFSELERGAVSRFWKTQNLCSGPGLKAVDLFRSVRSGDVKFLWVMGTNPAVSMPDAGFVREALGRCETLVASDIIADTDTARFAHIRLPALGWGEKDGTVTNSERRISRQRAVLPAPGEARADWAIVSDVARRLGHETAFAYDNPAAIFREFAAMTAIAKRLGKKLDLTSWAECSDAQYEAMRPFQWGGAKPLARSFSHPGGKARLISVAPPAATKREVTLNTGRYRDHWHTMTRTGLSAKLSQHRREPLVEVSPADAERLRLVDGGLARVSGASADTVYRVCVTGDQQDGQIFVPMHFTDRMSGGGRTGLVVTPATDPHSGQPAFKNCAVDIAPFHSEWSAFLVRRDAFEPTGIRYWATARIEGGWLTELAGTGALDTDSLLPGGCRSEVADIRRGMRRIAVRSESGEIFALLYVTRSGVLPKRDWVERQFAAADADATELLAGRPSVPQPDRGPLVCVCHDVGETDIRRAADAGADTLEAVGKATCAGTNCGSCRPIIARLLEEHAARLKEAAQ